MRKKYKLKENYIVVILFMIFFLFQFIQIFQFKFFVQSDDFGYIANSAFFAGYNWNPYTGDMTPYYNIGFSIFSAFAFRIFHSATAIYQCLLFTILVWQLILMYFVYRISYEFFKLDKKISAVIAILYSIGTMSPQTGLYFMAEIPFAFVCILILYFLLKAKEENGKRQKTFSALAAGVIAVSYAVHTRFLIIAGTVLGVGFLYHLIYKKKLVHYLTFFVTLIITFGLVYIGVKYVQGTLYRTGIEGRVINGNDALARLGYIEAYLSIFTNLEQFKEFIRYFLSLVGIYTLITGGIIWIAGISVVEKLIQMWKEKDCSDIGKVFFILSVTGLVSFVGMNLLIAMNGAANITEYKWLTYYRYGKPFVGIIFLVALADWFKNGIKRPTILISYAGVIFSLYMVLRFPMRMLQNALYEDVSPVGWMHYYFYNGQSPTEYFKSAVVIVFIISTIFMFLFIKNKKEIALAIYVAFSVALALSENAFNEKISRRNYEMVDGTMKFMEQFGDKIDVPIYFLQGSYSGRLRFALYDTDMEYLFTDEELENIDYENAIVLADKNLINSDINGNRNQPLYKIEIDDYEYVFTSNKQIYDMVK